MWDFVKGLKIAICMQNTGLKHTSCANHRPKYFRNYLLFKTDFIVLFLPISPWNMGFNGFTVRAVGARGGGYLSVWADVKMRGLNKVLA
jgi:hypothetical protein